MTDHQWGTQLGVADTALAEPVQIRAADAHRGDPDERFVPRRLGRRLVVKVQLTDAVQPSHLHSDGSNVIATSGSCRTCTPRPVTRRLPARSDGGRRPTDGLHDHDEPPVQHPMTRLTTTCMPIGARVHG